MIPLSEGYARRNQPVDFVIALIQLEAPHLFEIRDCFEEIDTEIVESFKDFLKKHINTNKHSKQQGNCNFPENFQQITVIIVYYFNIYSFVFFRNIYHLSIISKRLF